MGIKTISPYRLAIVFFEKLAQHGLHAPELLADLELHYALAEMLQIAASTSQQDHWRNIGLLSSCSGCILEHVHDMHHLSDLYLRRDVLLRGVKLTKVVGPRIDHLEGFDLSARDLSRWKALSSQDSACGNGNHLINL